MRLIQLLANTVDGREMRAIIKESDPMNVFHVDSGSVLDHAHPWTPGQDAPQHEQRGHLSADAIFTKVVAVVRIRYMGSTP
jgi:hypothetical protein